MKLAITPLVLAVVAHCTSRFAAAEGHLRGRSLGLSAQDSPQTCHAVGTYQTGLYFDTGTTEDVGMLCFYPTNTNETFPLISFAHGWGGGSVFIFGYSTLFQSIASSGFVICGYTDCLWNCPSEREKPLLKVIAKAKRWASGDGNLSGSPMEVPEVPDVPDTPAPTAPAVPAARTGDDLAEEIDDMMGGEVDDVMAAVDVDDIIEEATTPPKLPIRKEGDVGVIGYSSGGIPAIFSAYNDTAEEHSIGAVVLYEGDGVAYATNMGYGAGIDLRKVHPNLALFFAAGTEWISGIEPQCLGHAYPNVKELVESNPNQPLLAACIDDMTHLDPWDELFRKAPLIAFPYVLAFLAYTLDPQESCMEEYTGIMGEQLENISSTHYQKNNLF